MKYTMHIILAAYIGHSPHGECGLKSFGAITIYATMCHSPHGECGLKSLYYRYINTDRDVTPRMGSAG